MGIIRFTITHPVTVTVGVLLVCLFGILALFHIPIQLTPNVDEPKVTVMTRWPGKSAREIEREIIERQEEKLKSVTGLRKMTSEAVEGLATVTLEFFVGTDRNESLRGSDEKLNQVSGYPPDVEKPEIEAADSALSTPIAWLLFYSKDGKTDVSTLRDFVWDEVKPILERVPGLASVDVFGGREREVQVLIDPDLLAVRGLTLRDIEAALHGENVNTSAGTVAVGRREFIYRTVGEYEDPQQVADTVIAYQAGGPVFVRDVGRVVKTFEKVRSFVRSKGQPVLGIPVRREVDANVIEVMGGLKQQIVKVNREILSGRSLQLELTQVYDETVYIHSAIALVRSNLYTGGVLATLVLLLFLRNVRATAVVAVSIPISVIATFLVVSLAGRNINVVMLSGMAFAVGMVVDNAVVVLENIYRHKQMGKTGLQAAQEGAGEVWGALLGSTLTTMAVFIPVIFIKEEAGQLFRDISIAICAGVGMSLLVSVLVIPCLSARALGRAAIPVVDETPGRRGGYATLIADFVSWVNRRLLSKWLLIIVLVSGSLLGSWALMPPTDYLPGGNRNLIFGFMITEPGLSIDALERIGRDLESNLRPYWSAQAGTPEAERLKTVLMPQGGKKRGNEPPPMVEVRPAPIKDFFYVAFNNQGIMGATSQDPLNVKPLQQVMTNAMYNSPSAIGSFAFFYQVPLFGNVRSGGGNSVDLDIRGQDLNKVTAAAGQLFRECWQRFGPTPPKPSPPNFDLPRPEIRAVPDRVRSADVGLNVRDVGFIVEAAVDGAYVGGFRDAGDEVDMVVKLEKLDGTAIRDVKNVPVYTPLGRIVPLSSVVEFKEVGAPQQINHIEEMPGVTLSVQAPQGEALESVMDTIQNEIVAPLRQQGRIDSSVFVSLAGNADKLEQTRSAMFGHWSGFNLDSLLALVQSRGFLALLITYLLMAALFESFVYPLAIMLTVPLAAVGGFAGLRIVHWLSLRNPIQPVQQLDVVTMLGFVILVGIVVNNAILIVHQTLNNISYGMDHAAALHESVRTRIRPIFMTSFTTVCGQLPLALVTGSGSELYRGLAAVMVGGLFCATIFTLVLIPVVFSMFLTLRTKILHRFGREEVVPRHL